VVQGGEAERELERGPQIIGRTVGGRQDDMPPGQILPTVAGVAGTHSVVSKEVPGTFATLDSNPGLERWVGGYRGYEVDRGEE